MDIDFGSVNYLAIVAAVVLNMALGALWYSPLLFARPWMAANGFTEEQIRAEGAGIGYGVSVVVSVVLAFAVALLAEAVGADMAVEGLLLGLLVGVGFVATTAGVNYVFEIEAAQPLPHQRGLPRRLPRADRAADRRLAVGAATALAPACR